MMNAVGEPQSVLLLGGTSEIGRAIIQALPSSRLERVILAGRPSTGLESRCEELASMGISKIEAVDFDARNISAHAAVIDQVFDKGDIDMTILAFGVLGNQEELERDPHLAVQMVETNYVGAVSVGLHVARRLRSQGHGSLVVLSSVAGDRARRANFIYGSSKAGLDAFAQGLGDSLVGSGTSVIVVRPGFVKTSMTHGLEEAPFATSAEEVGARVAASLAKGRETVYVPGILRPVMGVVKALPRKLFRRLPS